MKIRTDFVTNSSSSSFTLTICITEKNGDTIRFTGHAELESPEPYTELHISASPRKLANSFSVSSLVSMLAQNIDTGRSPNDDYWFERYFDDFCNNLSDDWDEDNVEIEKYSVIQNNNGIKTIDTIHLDSFLEHVSRIPSMQSISEISIQEEETTESDSYTCSYTYHTDIDVTVVSAYGKRPFTSEGRSGSIDFRVDGKVMDEDEYWLASMTEEEEDSGQEESAEVVAQREAEQLEKEKQEAIELYRIDQDASVTFLDKHFVLTGFMELEAKAVAEIERRGGIVHDSMVKKADYLVICLKYGPGNKKYNKALEWREKGVKNLIIGDDQLNRAIDEVPALSWEEFRDLMERRDAQKNRR